MNQTQIFKKETKDKIVNSAKNYQKYFIDYDYLLFSDAFVKNSYYIIKGDEGNFKHLTGVILVSDTPKSFFNKCINDTLCENDFDVKKHASDKETKGLIRKKMSVINDALCLFKNKVLVEEDFKRNNIKCSIATTNGSATLGFTPTGTITRPKTLLQGDHLNPKKAKEVKLVLRKKRKDKKFNEILVGNSELLCKYKDYVSNIVDKKLFK